jgi:hypothetical protein
VSSTDLGNGPSRHRQAFRRFRQRFCSLRGLIGRRGRGACDASADARAAIGAIERLLEAMESEFQTLSQNLIDCFTRSKSVAAEAGAIPAMLGEDEGSGTAGDALQEILGLADGMHSRCGQASHLLGEVCDSTGHLQKGIDSRRQFLSTFQVMQTMSQIEIARLGQEASDFGALGEEMTALAVRIREETGRIGDITGALGVSANEAANRARAIETSEERSLPEITAGARHGLDALLASRAAAAHASSGVAGRYGNVSASVEQLVSSMQSHDIARQQLEHVVEALRPIADGDASGASRVAALQVAHIWQARESFLEAAGRITASLENISQNVLAISTEAATLLNGDTQKQDEAHERITGQDIEGILQALTRFEASETNIAAAAASVLNGIREISGSVDEVQAIGVRMQRIALNSSIQSSHLGETGAPLGVLADLARTLATDAEAWAETVSQDLGVISNKGDALSAIASQAAAGGNAQIGAAAQHMRNVLTKLGERDGRGRERIGLMEQHAHALRAKIEAVGNSIAIEPRASELADESIRCLQRTIAGTDNADFGPADLAELAARYTMQSERDVHSKLTGSAETAEMQVVAAAPRQDDIELF